ncbi:patatin [Lacihabitans sp. LS3-19]|uniref:patatin-like phospholipase family protein n=1 Tax=Lacihabitans sp. LS3-19 TaxID=2487335 RepID=UPI0020CF8B14|nr:patatin-like phospholipase family protein [Lacihabitans sp. LS3-19]MCP9768640.1 patatin [Lacihabitans sp. LS3-19]
MIQKVLVFILIFCSFQLPAQQKTVYRNLVMEGGGIKGIAYGGALVELEKNGILQNISRVAGTSAGAIQASLLAIGYSPKDIVKIVNETPIETFNDDGFIARGSKRLFKEFGWFRGDSFLRTLENLIYQKTGNANLTFEELHHLARTTPYRDLYVTGSNLTEQVLEVFSYETYPKMRIADAVRVSMSIPLYYRSLWISKEGKVFEQNTPEENTRLFVDGGLLLNYPIDVFDDKKYNENLNSGDFFNEQTLGLRLEKCQQIDHELSKKSGLAEQDIVDFGSYMDALGGLIMRNVNPPNPRDTERTIYINDLGLSARVRKVPDFEKVQMMTAGQQAVIEFFGR